MEATIIRRGKPAGTVTLRADGLYWQLEAVLPPDREILRLYMPQPLGVFVPEDGRLVLRKRLSRSSLPVPGRFAVAWCAADGKWTPGPGPRCRFLPAGIERAVPWRTDGPVDFPAAPGALTLIRLEAQSYLCACIPYDVT